MTLAALALAIFANITAQTKINAIAPDWVLVSTPLKWESHPRKAEFHIHTAPATLLVVYPNGMYAEVACLLIEQTDGRVTISHGDGYIVRSGTWKTVDNKLVANATVVFRTLWLVSKKEPESSRDERFRIEQVRGHRELLEDSGQKYAPLPRFSDFDSLATFINSSAIPQPAEW